VHDPDRCDYHEVSQRLAALCADEDDHIAIMASICCELYHADARFDWVGFYRAVGDSLLRIGPYQGGHGCLTIPFSRGVCGAAARLRKVQIVDDVNSFDGHIACASSTRAELVIPFDDAQGRLIGVLDIDSDRPAAFDATDAAQLQALLQMLFARP